MHDFSLPCNASLTGMTIESVEAMRLLFELEKSGKIGEFGFYSVHGKMELSRQILLMGTSP
jgi:hypothetical protein